MFDIPRLYISACSNSVQLVPLHPIIISILLHHYKELKGLVSEVDRIEEAEWMGTRTEEAAAGAERHKKQSMIVVDDVIVVATPSSLCRLIHCKIEEV